MTESPSPRILALVALLVVVACAIPERLAPPTATRAVTPVGPVTGPSQPWPTKDLSTRPQIWFGPLDPIDWSASVPGGSGYDFFSLFDEDSPWLQAADATRVMVLYPIWLSSAGKTQIQRVVDDLRRRNIAIAFEGGPLTEFGPCNAGTIEGFAGPAANRRIAQNLGSAGGVLYTWSLEHGFDAATYYDPDCRMTPQQVAEDVAGSVAAVREVFPNVRIGSIETGDLSVDDLAAWLSAYREVMGEELAYLHLDVPFYVPDWAARALAIEQLARSRGIEFGIFYTGDPEDTSDEQWLGKAEQRFVEYEAVAGGRPDHAIFQSWNPHPVALLPESGPATFTWLITRYLRERTALTVESDGAVAQGVLSADAERSLEGFPVTVWATAQTGPGTFQDFSFSGRVPEGMTHGNVGLRVNTECQCSGPAELLLASASYQEQGSTSLVPNGMFRNGRSGWGTWGSGVAVLESGLEPGLRLSAGGGQDIGVNSDAFPVTAGSPFTVTFRARVDPPTMNSGYFAVFFLDEAGEGQRFTIPWAVTPTEVGETRTDAEGRFTISLAGLPDGRWTLRAWFPGNDALWPASSGTEVDR